MTAADRYRRVLLATAAVVFAGTPAELWLVDHVHDWQQWVPFGLCALGLAAVAGVWLAPRPGVLRAARVAFAAAVVGSAAGVYFHLAGNVAFEREIRPGAGALDVLGDALAGASPLLASGVLALAGVLGWAGTLWHEPAAPRAGA